MVFTKTTFTDGQSPKVGATWLNALQDWLLAHTAQHAPGGSDTVFPANAAGHLKNNGSGTLSWEAATGGTIGGASGSTDNAIIRADGTGGLTIQSSLITVDDSGSINIPSGQSYKKNNSALAASDVGAFASADSITLADGKSVELKKALGTDHTCSGLTVTLKAHENTTLFQVGFINSDGEVALSDADAIATMPVRVMATAGINANADGIYLLKGYAVDASWSWTPGGALYASGTPGAVTQTAPTGTGKVVQIVGYAVAATIICFAPDMTFIELA